MLAEAGGARIPREPRDAAGISAPDATHVAVIVALRVERRCLGHVGPRLSLIQSGPGETRAAAAAARALGAGARALVSFGLAGGLVADARPGRLLVPSRVLTAAGRELDVDPRWHAQIIAALRADFDLDERPIFAAADVLENPTAKRQAAARGAAAVDLESGAIGAAAAEAGVPFAVVRAVADGPDDTLPPGAAGWVAEDGETRVAPVVRAALRPSNWLGLWMLARRYRAARESLVRAAKRLAADDFLFT